VAILIAPAVAERLGLCLQARTLSAASRWRRAAGLAAMLFGRRSARRCIVGCVFCALRRRL